MKYQSTRMLCSFLGNNKYNQLKHASTHLTQDCLVFVDLEKLKDIFLLLLLSICALGCMYSKSELLGTESVQLKRWLKYHVCITITSVIKNNNYAHMLSLV